MVTADRFGDIPARAAALWGEREAWRFGEDSLSFGEVDDQVDRAARALLARGIGRGDTVGLWLTNRLEFVIAFYAILRIGASVAPMNTRYREHDAAYTLKLADCKALFVVERSGEIEYLEMLRNILPGFDGSRFDGAADVPALEHVVIIGDVASPLGWKRFLEEAGAVSAEAFARATDSVRPDDTALIVFTSGTTGKSKAVLHDHTLLRNIRERHQNWPLRTGDKALCFLPMFHAFGMAEQLVGGMLTGVRQIILDSWDAERALDLVEQEGVTALFGFETHYADMLAAQERRPRDLSTLGFGALPAGLPTSNAIALKVQRAMCPTVSGFGMSEIGCYVCVSTLDDTEEQRCTTSGRPSAGLTIRIIDPATGEDCATGEPGEIIARGYTLMRGYYRNPEDTARAIDAGGWFHTGDQGLLRPDGFLQIIGRYKEMLRVGGENVSPAVLEEELAALVPSIQHVAVVGVPNARLVEVAAAFIVPKPGEECSLETVRDACRGKIASFKIPRHVVCLDSLPMTASGKVQRLVLREQALHTFAPPE